MLNNIFRNELSWMRQEIANLKIAQSRGIGLIDYYQTSIAVNQTSTNTATITATPVADAVKPIFVQFGIEDNYGAIVGGSATRDGDNVVFKLAGWYKMSTTITATSSAKITLSVSYS